MLGINRRFSLCRYVAVFFCTVFCLFDTGCIPVDDLGIYWDKGIIDSELEGHWKLSGVKHRSQDQYLSFNKKGDFLELTQIDADEIPPPPGIPKNNKAQVRTLKMGPCRYMMIRQRIQNPQPASMPATSRPFNNNNPLLNCLQRYAVKNNVLMLFELDESVFKEAVQSGNINGTLPKDTKEDENQVMEIYIPSITTLDEKTVKTLGQLASEAGNWKLAATYNRVKNLKKALETSRRYPSTKDTPKHIQVNLQLPDLKYFAEGKEEVLLRQLEASPEWKVFKDGDEIVAYRREFLSGKWEVSLNGYRHGGGLGKKRWQIRYLFRFSRNVGGAFARLGFLTKSNPCAGKIQLKLKSSDQGIESYLAVGEGVLWFEFFEQTDEEDRIHSRKALDWLAKFLRSIRAAEKEINENGYAAEIMPKESTKKGNPSIEVKDGFQGGIYDVYAWINPGSESEVFLKVFDAKTNARLSEDRITPRSSERIGWSQKPGTLFFYNSNITVYEGDWDHFYNARFELWTKDDKTGKEKKLVETTHKICGWER